MMGINQIKLLEIDMITSNISPIKIRLYYFSRYFVFLNDLVFLFFANDKSFIKPGLYAIAYLPAAIFF